MVGLGGLVAQLIEGRVMSMHALHVNCSVMTVQDHGFANIVVAL